MNQVNTQIAGIKDTLGANSLQNKQQEDKLKEINETLFKLDNVQVPAINTRLTQLATKDDLTKLKLNLMIK